MAHIKGCKWIHISFITRLIAVGSRRNSALAGGASYVNSWAPFYNYTAVQEGLPRRHHYRYRQDIEMCGDLTPWPSLPPEKDPTVAAEYEALLGPWLGMDLTGGGGRRAVLFPMECNVSGSDRTTLKGRRNLAHIHWRQVRHSSEAGVTPSLYRYGMYK
jgi:hypothetical protein